uniref:Ionotropic glutamate receptor L-glutamate and glycine-binding domain-containing protein n=1 Tax=Stomoxys calcitrans TaxID=35570 RepID=A0A1I8Q106_STOCA
MDLLFDSNLENNQTILNLRLILSLVWIIKKDFEVKSISPPTIGQYAINALSRQHQGDMIERILKIVQADGDIVIPCQTEGELHPLGILDIVEGTGAFQESHFRAYPRREKFIWFLDSLEAYKNLEKEILNPKHHYHHNGYFLLVYTGQEQDPMPFMKTVFESLYGIYITNVNIMLLEDQHPVLYTYFPFAPNKCHSPDPEYLTSFKGIESYANFTLNRKLFPIKVANMHGCNLTILTWEYLPYMKLEFNVATGKLRLDGIEGSLITLLSERMNFSLTIKEAKTKDRGVVYPNQTATGVSKMMINKEANITIVCYLYSKARAEVMLPSRSYLGLSFYLAIPHGRALNPFERLMKPFHYIIWSCFSSSLIFAIVFVCLIRFMGKTQLQDFLLGPNNRTPLLNLLLTLFGGVIYRSLPYRNFARYILTLWIIYTMVLRTAYLAELFKILQDGNSRKTMSTLKDVVEQNCTVYAFPAVVEVLKSLDSHMNIRHLDGKNTPQKILERLTDPTNKENIAVCLYDFSLRWYNQVNPSRRVQVLPQRLMTSPIVFFMPAHSYLSFQTGELIFQMLQSGITKRLESFFLHTTLSGSLAEDEHSMLSLNQLSAVFWIYAALLLLSVIIFVVELCSKKSKRMRNVIKSLSK